VCKISWCRRHLEYNCLLPSLCLLWQCHLAPQDPSCARCSDSRISSRCSPLSKQDSSRCSCLVHFSILVTHTSWQPSLAECLLQLLHLAQRLRLPHKRLKSFLLFLGDLQLLATACTVDCRSSSIAQRLVGPDRDDTLRELCGCIERPEQLLRLLALYVFDLLEV